MTRSCSTSYSRRSQVPGSHRSSNIAASASSASSNCTMESPFHNLAFTAVCGELPFLKLSHAGLFDVQRRKHLPTLVEDEALVA